MHKFPKIFLQAIRGQETSRNPIWLMRQAGRYLPEYKLLREKEPNFLNFCLNPTLAFEAVLQPLRRYNFDAAILFSDILMVPYGLGQDVVFKEKEGPRLAPIQTEKDLAKLVFDPHKLEPVFKTMDLMTTRLPHSTARIGFCGGLWTVACYMIDGHSGDGFKGAMTCVQHQPAFLNRLMEVLEEATLIYLSKQIEAGAEVIQIFDSWAGLLSEKKFRQWVIDPTLRLVSELQKKYPEVPVIGFPRGATPADYCAYVNETGVDALSIDQHIPLSFAIKELQSVKPLQGNLDPDLLIEGGEKMQMQVEKILEAFGPGHIFNLGHGIKPETPPENVAELVRLVREAEWVKSENSGDTV